MTQDFTEDPYDPDHVADTDLENMEDNFLTLKSSFSGPASPPNPVAGLDWFDTAKKVKKVRNTANDAWLGLMHADASHKIPVYRNNQPDGWLIDSGVTDCVIALKGGSQAYNTAAGAIAGTWQNPDHTLTVPEMPIHTHGIAFDQCESGDGDEEAGRDHACKVYPPEGINRIIMEVLNDLERQFAHYNIWIYKK